MTKFSPFKLLGFGLVALAIVSFGAAPAQAQNQFKPAIKVNDKVITGFELSQRARMLQVFRSQGDPNTEARRQLIEERLKMDAAEANGILPSRDEVELGMEEFAARASMSTKQFLGSF